MPAPWADKNSYTPLQFSIASKLAQPDWTNGTLFIASDDVYKAGNQSTGGFMFLPGVAVDNTIKMPQPDDPNAGKFHYQYFSAGNIGFIWDDYAPGNPLGANQKYGPGDADRRINIFTGMDAPTCWATDVIRCDDGFIYTTSCVLQPLAPLSKVLATQSIHGEVSYRAWMMVIERAGLTAALDALPPGVTVFVPNDTAVANAGLPGGYSPTQLAQIVAFNILTTGTYFTGDNPADPLTTALANHVLLIDNNRAILPADLTFTGGVVQVVGQVYMPGSLDGQVMIPGFSPTVSMSSATITSMVTANPGPGMTNQPGLTQSTGGSTVNAMMTASDAAANTNSRSLMVLSVVVIFVGFVVQLGL
ncbi:hypothetical protein HDU76_012417 [Blyttiomyces sp. JEL0837]|nr:hypothetical protein HDU76_012417 [Blyttiomyces sp. JEL0837]